MNQAAFCAYRKNKKFIILYEIIIMINNYILLLLSLTALSEPGNESFVY